MVRPPMELGNEMHVDVILDGRCEALATDPQPDRRWCHLVATVAADARGSASRCLASRRHQMLHAQHLFSERDGIAPIQADI
eukprot:7390424-Prymnesium_polylepis.1